MRQAIRDLVASVDPYARLDLEAEDALLDVASEFLDSVTNFSSRLARHRSSDSLDVKDLQLHLERHHQIRIPGFAGDDLSKLPAFPNGPSKANAAPSRTKDKDGKERPAPTIRSKRLAAAKAATANAGKS
ncbi:transcription initiation factor TFIID subunit A-domain-containing protein [Cantharellus anzutake]|uniref:transcription initiation factor TFIID subunit A-domain-containing protein n=1 Tax=Cantharellus anzutake TaxID=1750568 RepID=UPI001903A31F|nr:transcription initiation factor TFIID subunit A-domain-containing protein [Cantharellus anzutake]KAF8331901.1 transcription initiation factor TFIID subunit A-domain-containing protein [Cantharellus anzutake]